MSPSCCCLGRGGLRTAFAEELHFPMGITELRDSPNQGMAPPCTPPATLLRPTLLSPHQNDQAKIPGLGERQGDPQGQTQQQWQRTDCTAPAFPCTLHGFHSKLSMFPIRHFFLENNEHAQSSRACPVPATEAVGARLAISAGAISLNFLSLLFFFFPEIVQQREFCEVRRNGQLQNDFFYFLKD